LLEPDVTLTDFALAIECGIFALWLARGLRADTSIRSSFVVLFAASALAALLGGISHGFLPDAVTLPAQIVWLGTLAAIGVAAVACAILGARLILPARAIRGVAAVAGILLIVYLAVILLVSRSFTVAIAGYAPAMAFLLIAFAIAWRRTGAAAHLAGAAGVALAFVAAAVQQARIEIDPVYLGYNALYHLIQALAFALLFLAARGLLRRA
jgi:hypothetical protein